MNELLIIHLSDLHLTAPKESNPCWRYKDQFIDAAVQESAACSSALVVLSGDIAQSGKSAEYDVAIDLLLDLQDSLEQRCDIRDVQYCSVPGNHDCDFSLLPADRGVLLRARDDELNAGIIDRITAVQDPFFAFSKTLEEAQQAASGLSRVHRVRTIVVDGKIIKVNLINTSWTSQNPEKYGELRMPKGLRLDDEADLVLTVLHHPLSWLRPEDAHDLRGLVEKHSDLIFTGHIHSESLSTTQQSTGGSFQLFEAGSFQEKAQPDHSEFRLVRINLWNDSQESRTCRLRSGQYVIVSRHDGSVVHNRNRLQSAFQPQPDFAEWLHDPGHGLTHPKVKKLRLHDFFVMPNLVRATKEQTTSKLIKAPAVLESLARQRSLIMAPESAGKTALLRHLAESLSRMGLVPVVVKAAQITASDARDPASYFSDLVGRHYGETAKAHFQTLPFGDRALLIDDLQALALDESMFTKFMATASAMFKTIVLASTNDFALRELLTASRMAADLPLRI